eukprot:c9400_g1_i1 orf=185-4822(+)
MDVSPSLKENCSGWAVSTEPAQLQLQLAIEPGETPLHRVGSLQVQHRLQLGFICGSLPVPTDNDAMTFRTTSVAEAAIVPAISVQSDRIMAPQYRMLPNQTDLNRLFLSEVEHDQLLPVTSGRAPEGVHELCKAWGYNYHTQPLARKCEALAVSGLAGCGDQIDVIAPVEILKKIFKIPYSKARLSIAVHRVGQTLILNTGPDVDEGETLVRTKKDQAKAKEKSLFLKFAMQSVRAEACDCPVSPNLEEQSSSNFTSKSSSDSISEFDDDSLNGRAHVGGWKYTVDDVVNKKKRAGGSTKSLNTGRGRPQHDFEQRVSWSSSDTGSFSGLNSLKKSSIVGEQQKDPDCIPSDSGNHKRSNSEGFLRVLFWQLEEMRMLLGSDLLLFSNEKHVAVSLHLWEAERQVTPLMWLDAWLDNVMASVPELAICYHHNGIVQGYELLKTDDIFLLKGLSADGTSFFHPHVVQQNALSVLRFLQENCKQDLGTYWLFKNSGEDLVQLFDLSVISSNSTTTAKKDVKKESLPSSWSRGKGSCSLPLGILLYRLAHRLSLSQDPSDRCKCANFFKKCLELLGEQEHLFVRASAHEHVARLILKCHEELGSSLVPFLLEAKEPDDSAPERPVLENSASSPQTHNSDILKLKSCGTNNTSESRCESSDVETAVMVDDSFCEGQEKVPTKEKAEPCSAAEADAEQGHIQSCSSLGSENSPLISSVEASPILQDSSDVDVTFPTPNLSVVASVPARLTAVHHVSQAIKALRWQRQLQDVEGKLLTPESKLLGANNYVHLVPVCVYGELDRIEYCDIRECEIGPFMDQKLVQLVLLLGESYLALGQAYKDNGQVNQALKAAELACSVYESMPLQFGHKDGHTSVDQKSQWVPVPSTHPSEIEMPKPPSFRSRIASQTFCQPFFHDSDPGKHADKGLFWGQAWILAGDIYVDYQRFGNDDLSEKKTQKSDEISMAEEVAKEVKRLRKKLGQGRKSCCICSLSNCSCENDRANSGNSASSSSSSGTTSNHSRRHSKKANTHEVDRNSARYKLADEVTNYDRKGDSDSSRQKLASNSSDQKAYNTSKSLELAPGSNKLDSSIGTPKDKVGDMKQRKKGDILSYLQGSKNVSRENNLLAALECYDAAVLALADTSQGSEMMKSVLRKKGWIYNEIGRTKLAYGNMKAAEPVFEKAISAFKDAEDQTNVVLIYCNIGHGQRAAAESLVSQLDSLKGTQLFEHVSKQLFDDALSLYSEALRAYGMGRSESKLLSEDLENERTGLCNEVLTQYANTYLRLGMLLDRKEKHGSSVRRAPAESSNCENGNSQTIKISLTANDAIREAITLYESLGSLRAQELAFAQYQLACHHRDCCLATVKLEGKKPNNTLLLQQAKRYLSLADRHWLKSLKYYRWTTHPDMFLEILMQRSDLNVAVSSLSNSLPLLEVALSHLLEGRHIQVSATTAAGTCNQSGRECLQPSDKVYFRLTQKLQNLLRILLVTAQKLQKTSSHKSLTAQTKNHRSADNNNKREAHRSGDVVRLKEMYRMALKSEMPDLKQIYDMWIS